MQKNGIPDFSKLSNDPFIPKQIRQLNYLNAVILGMGCCCLVYWYYLTNGDMLRKIDSESKTHMQELLIPMGAIYLFMQGVSGLISFQMIRPMSLRKLWFVMWVSMIVTGIIVFFITVQKV